MTSDEMMTQLCDQLLAYVDKTEKQYDKLTVHDVAIFEVARALKSILTGMTCEDEGCPHFGTPHAHVKSRLQNGAGGDAAERARIELTRIGQEMGDYGPTESTPASAPSAVGGVSKAIYKYTLNLTHREQLLACPVDTRIVAFQFQDGQPRIWAEVSPDKPNCDIRLAIIGTGGEVPTCGRYVGTWQEGIYVWHLYEIKA